MTAPPSVVSFDIYHMIYYRHGGREKSRKRERGKNRWLQSAIWSNPFLIGIKTKRNRFPLRKLFEVRKSASYFLNIIFD